MSTKERLYSFLEKKLVDYDLILVSNRQPYEHRYSSRGVDYTTPAGGLTAALDPVMQATKGVWIAWGSGTADRDATNEEGHVKVPPGKDLYLLHRLWLTKQDLKEYYYGFSNQVMWPLFHNAFGRPSFKHSFWRGYERVNQKFAASVNKELEQRKDRNKIVWIQDYQLAICPQWIQRDYETTILLHFWHIPWPSSELFGICPWRQELLRGLLHNDIVGFHIREYVYNFLRSVERYLPEAEVDYRNRHVVYKNNITHIREYPISVDFDYINHAARSRKTVDRIKRLRSNMRFQFPIIGLGVDRMDYTKGIVEKLNSLAVFLKKYRHYRKKFVYILVAPPSRSRIDLYRRIGYSIQNMVSDINWDYQAAEWQPIIFMHENLPLDELIAYYRMADFLIVSSLHDGMNLVAKEYVASQVDQKGVLLISEFTGAAKEMKDALIINPFDTEQFARRIGDAIRMPVRERKTRMQRLQDYVAKHDIYHWLYTILTDALDISTERKLF